MSFTDKLRVKSASLADALTGGNKNKAFMPESDVEGENENLLGKPDNFLTL